MQLTRENDKFINAFAHVIRHWRNVHKEMQGRGRAELSWLTARAEELQGMDNGGGAAQWFDYGGRMSHIKCSRFCSPMNYYGAVAFDIYVL